MTIPFMLRCFDSLASLGTYILALLVMGCIANFFRIIFALLSVFSFISWRAFLLAISSIPTVPRCSTSYQSFHRIVHRNSISKSNNQRNSYEILHCAIFTLIQFLNYLYNMY